MYNVSGAQIDQNDQMGSHPKQFRKISPEDGSKHFKTAFLKNVTTDLASDVPLKSMGEVETGQALGGKSPAVRCFSPM